jgi:hypothetical protein
LVEIYLRTSHGPEAVQLLTSSTLNVESEIGQRDPQLIMSLLLHCLGTTTQAGTRLSIAQTLVKDSTYHSDDRLWAALKDVYLQGDREA